MTGDVYVVWCSTHRHYLRHVGVTGTSWTADQSEAKRYPSKPKADADADRATSARP